MNAVTILGRLTRDPELKYSPSGTATCRFAVAVDRQLTKEKKQEMESKNQPTADFLNIVCWGKLAETVNQYTAKGKRILVEGRIQTGSYTDKDGNRRYTTDIVASSVQFIDWKDREQTLPSATGDTSQNGGYSAARSATPSSDDFFGDDFTPIDDDRIPF